MSKVVSIGKNPVPDEGEPNEVLIAFLREMLERAESGEIQGVGMVALHADRTANWHVAGLVGGLALLGASTLLQAYFADDVRGRL
jgi:hypothetical protein